MNRPAPRAIRNSAAAGRVTIEWTAAEIQEISHLRLRGACPCAGCRAARLRGRITAVEETVKVTAIQSFPYGVQLVFSDGHDRGIYPWNYLYEIHST